MTKKRTGPKVNRDQKRADLGSGQNSEDGLTDAEKAVGVHILGKKDMQRHFGTADVNSDQHGPIKDNKEANNNEMSN